MRRVLPRPLAVLVLVAVAAQSRGDDIAWLDNGLSESDRRQFHHLPIGSELMPLAWLRALDTADGSTPFVARLEHHGFLPDADDPDGLPVGMSAVETGGGPFRGKMVGLTCAACHTGALAHGGRTVRIVGMPNMLSVESFTEELTEAIAATAKHPRRLAGFVKRLATQDRTAAFTDRPEGALLATRLPDFDHLDEAGSFGAAIAARLEQAVATVAEEPEVDLARPLATARAVAATLEAELRQLPGRLLLDARALAARGHEAKALAGETEEALATGLDQWWAETVETARLLRGRAALLRKQSTMARMTAPRGGPGRIDDFGFARNLIFPSAEMRVPDAPCSIPVLWATSTVRWQGWDANNDSAMGRNLATAMASGATFDAPSGASTALPRNLGRIEELAARITVPRWPEDWLGAIDQTRAARGEALFRTHCHDCHPTGAGPAPDRVVPLAEIGTDPNRARNFAAPLGGRPFAVAIEETLGRFKQVAYAAAGIDAAEAARLDGGRSDRWRTTGGYAARPLAGLWASAPYLHNGSVPTLHDLLLPPAERPVRFPVGQRDFDPVRVGLMTVGIAAPMFMFDTTVSGNHATGHDYGTGLSADE
ncbi:MAG: hypothetical protein ACKO9B_07095, partial [Planctomycetota bacterium]